MRIAWSGVRTRFNLHPRTLLRLLRKNATLNEIENVEFICGKAEDALPDILDRRLKGAESLVAVVDPPRAGLHKRVLQVRI